MTQLMIRPIFGLTLALWLGGCVGAPPLACRAGQQATLTATLLFGRHAGGRLAVSDADWSRFLAGEITPRFPDGLTVFDASGQWRDPARGVATREPSKVVLIVYRDEPTAQARLTAIAEAYKRRFAQRSVGIVVNPGCASF
jgi:hypothetical protein